MSVKNAVIASIKENPVVWATAGILASTILVAFIIIQIATAVFESKGTLGLIILTVYVFAIFAGVISLEVARSLVAKVQNR